MMEFDQPISNLIKGFRNYNIKWGSKHLNDEVMLYNKTDGLSYEEIKTSYVVNDLCKNTVVCSMAINAILSFIFKDYEEAIEKNDEELKYVCWIRYKKAIRLAEEMDLGSGSFGKTHATFDNISHYTAKSIRDFFLIKYKNNLTRNDIDRLDTIYDTFDGVSKERKEELKKVCGDPFDVQIDLKQIKW